MSPSLAVARLQLRTVGGRFLPGLSLVMALAMFAVPAGACAVLLILAYGVFVGVPWGTLAQPSAAERCLPMSWTQLRRGRLALHLGFAACALPSIAAFALRARGGADLGIAMPTPALAALALLVPFWPLICTLMAPTMWRMGPMRVVLVAVVATLAIAAVIWLCVIAADGSLIAAAGVGAAALAAAPVACAFGADGDQGAWRGSLAAPVAAPEPPLMNRLRRLVAEPVSILPPVPRALMLGLWLRPGYFFGTLVLAGWMAFFSGTTPGVAIMTAIVFSSFVRLDSLAGATVGGLIPRRTALVALILPPVIAMVIGFAAGLADRPSSLYATSVDIVDGAAPPQQDARSWRVSGERDQVRLAAPLVETVQLRDGSRMPLDDWLRRRAALKTPTLPAMVVAERLARAIERDEHLRVDPRRLLTDDRGRVSATTKPVEAEIAATRLRQAILAGVAMISLAGVALLCAVPGRRRQRAGATTLFPYLVIIGGIILLSASIELLGDDKVLALSSDTAMPEVRVPWWDAGLTIVVANAWAVGSALIAVGLGCAALAVHRAKWLPLVPDSKPRLG